MVEARGELPVRLFEFGEHNMPLVSQLFRSNQRLQRCLIEDSAHVTLGSRGVHVSLIQYAVLRLEGGEIEGSEITEKLYGPTTADVVLAYKTFRGIINPAYQVSADNIVGRMTIATLDKEMLLAELRDSINGALPF